MDKMENLGLMTEDEVSSYTQSSIETAESEDVASLGWGLALGAAGVGITTNSVS